MVLSLETCKCKKWSWKKWHVAEISNTNKHALKTHNPVVIIICSMTRLGSSKTIQTYSPAIRPMLLVSPGHIVLVDKRFFLFLHPLSFPSHHLLTLHLPPHSKLQYPSPSTVQSQALAFIEQLKWGEGPHESTWVYNELLIRGKPSWGSRGNNRIQIVFW